MTMEVEIFMATSPSMYDSVVNVKGVTTIVALSIFGGPVQETSVHKVLKQLQNNRLV